MKVVTFIGSPYFGWELVTLREACKREGINPADYGVPKWSLDNEEVCYKPGEHKLCRYEAGKRNYIAFPQRACEFKHTLATHDDGTKAYIVST